MQYTYYYLLLGTFFYQTFCHYKNVSIFAFIKRTFLKQHIILYINHLQLTPSHFPPKSPYFSLTFYTFAFFNQNKKQLNERRITQMKELKKEASQQ